MENEITLVNDYILKDMVISALRYAIGRKSYIVDETVEFIMKNPKLINEKTKNVMLNDLKDLHSFYTDDFKGEEHIRKSFDLLKDFLLKL